MEGEKKGTSIPTEGRFECALAGKGKGVPVRRKGALLSGGSGGGRTDEEGRDPPFCILSGDGPTAAEGGREGCLCVLCRYECGRDCLSKQKLAKGRARGRRDPPACLFWVEEEEEEAGIENNWQ